MLLQILILNKFRITAGKAIRLISSINSIQLKEGVRIEREVQDLSSAGYEHHLVHD